MFNRYILLATLALPAIHCQAQAPVSSDVKVTKGSLKELDEKNGFRKYKFETNISAYPDLVPSSIPGDSKLYSKPDENLKVGTAQLKSIRYEFYKGRLASVMIHTEGTGNFTALLDALKAAYGEPQKPSPSTESYWWFGKGVNMNFSLSSISREGTVYLYSKTMTELAKRDKKAAAEEAISDL